MHRKKIIHSWLTIINFMQRIKHVCCKRCLKKKMGWNIPNNNINNTTICFCPIQHVPFKFHTMLRKSIPSHLNILIWQRNSIYLFRSMSNECACVLVRLLFARITLLSLNFSYFCCRWSRLVSTLLIFIQWLYRLFLFSCTYYIKVI